LLWRCGRECDEIKLQNICRGNPLKTGACTLVNLRAFKYGTSKTTMLF
jgi:hypothetical protein